jgi:hypothetical protein
MTTKWAQKAAEKASSRLVFEPSTEDRRKNWCYFRGLLKERITISGEADSNEVKAILERLSAIDARLGSLEKSK